MGAFLQGQPDLLDQGRGGLLQRAVGMDRQRQPAAEIARRDVQRAERQVGQAHPRGKRRQTSAHLVQVHARWQAQHCLARLGRGGGLEGRGLIRHRQQPCAPERIGLGGALREIRVGRGWGAENLTLCQDIRRIHRPAIRRTQARQPDRAIARGNRGAGLFDLQHAARIVGPLGGCRARD